MAQSIGNCVARLQYKPQSFILSSQPPFKEGVWREEGGEGHFDVSIKTCSRPAEEDERDRSKIDPGGGAEGDKDGGWRTAGCSPPPPPPLPPAPRTGIMMPHRRQEAVRELEQASRN